MTVLDAFDLAVRDRRRARSARGGGRCSGPARVDRAVRPARAQARSALPLVGGAAGRPDPGRLADMTSRSARACARVTTQLDNLGPTKLLGPEQVQVRHVADATLFGADIRNDASARAEFAGVDAPLEHLAARGRWCRERAGGLGDDVWACGPGPDAFHLVAA